MISRWIRSGLIASVVIVSLAIMASGCGGAAPSPAGMLMNKVSGCGSIQTWGGFSLDSNTVSEGQCEFDGTTLLKVYTWAAGDTADQADFMDFNSLCVVSGSEPVPWAVTMQIDSYVSTYATSIRARIASDLGGSSAGGQACTGVSPVGPLTVCNFQAPGAGKVGIPSMRTIRIEVVDGR
jgi:hypothetical protein